jgi:hypothetical protein
MNRVFHRKSKPLALVIAALFVSTALARSASAQTTQTPPAGSTTTTVFSPGNWTVTPFVGVGFSGNLDGGSGAFGAAGGYVWTDRVSFEGELNVLPSSENNGVFEVDSHSWSLTANALYHFSGRSWVPYGVFGIGLGHAGADLSGTPISGVSTIESSSTSLVANFGGGVERRLTDRVGFRGDLRYLFGGDLVPDYWRLGVGVTFGFRPR